jgi:hypothetical protein
MAKRAQPSSIDKLPPELRELIGKLRRNNVTIDEILGKLREIDPGIDVSRSALGRHVRKIAEIGERMRQSRMIAEQLTTRFGDQPDNRLARLNLELMHDVVMRTITAASIDEATGEASEMVFSAEDTMFLSRSLQSLATAQKTDVDRMDKEKKLAAEKATKEAAEKAVTAARSKGLSSETVDAIRFAVLGSDG